MMPNLLPSSIPADARILVRGVNWLGDAVMTTPALQRLRERFPRAHIALLTHENLADGGLHHGPGLAQLTSVGAGGVAGRDSATHWLRRALAKLVPYLPRAGSPGSCANAQTLSQGD